MRAGKATIYILSPPGLQGSYWRIEGWKDVAVRGPCKAATDEVLLEKHVLELHARCNLWLTILQPDARIESAV